MAHKYKRNVAGKFNSMLNVVDVNHKARSGRYLADKYCNISIAF